MSLQDVISTISQTSTIVIDFENWFTYFFGVNGVVSVGGNGSAVVVVGNNEIPSGMEAIVAWITQHVQIELSRPCSTCQNLTVSVPPPPGGAGENITENVTAPTNTTGFGMEEIQFVTAANCSMYFNSENYTVPDKCSLTNDSMGVCCDGDGQRHVCYHFDELIRFWSSQLSGTCQDIWDTWQAAGGDQAFRMELYNKFQLKGMQIIYGWLFFDQLWLQEVVAQGAVLVSGWSLTFDQCDRGFQFDFGDLDPQ